MTSVRDDLVSLFDFSWQRCVDRLAGVDDDEWRWTPTADDRIGLRWRLAHIADVLAEERNATWLGLATDHPKREPSVSSPRSVTEAMAHAAAAFGWWRSCLLQTTDESLAQPIGEIAGPYRDATRRGFALHIADELIHHTAEAALLRDLYAGRQGSR